MRGGRMKSAWSLTWKRTTEMDQKKIISGIMGYVSIGMYHPTPSTPQGRTHHPAVESVNIEPLAFNSFRISLQC
jgi:hypothetical protein